jgi:PAS domain S-box-containing protein
LSKAPPPRRDSHKEKALGIAGNFENRRTRNDHPAPTAGFAGDVICEYGSNGHLNYVSPNVENVLGMLPENVMNIGLLELIDPRDRRPLETALESQDGDRGEPWSAVLRMQHSDGPTKWLEAEGKTYLDEAGEARMIVLIRDETTHESRRTELKERLEVERLVAHVSQEFMASRGDEIDIAIEQALCTAASLAGADRSYLISIPNTDEAELHTYTWCEEGVPDRIPDTGKNVKGSGWIRSKIFSREVVTIPRVADLPDEASIERDRLIQYGVKSYLTIPVGSEEQLLGVVGFECHRREHNWSNREQSVLKLIAELFTGAIQRMRHEQARDASERALEDQIQFERGVAEISRRFLGREPEVMFDGVESDLQHLAELARAEHVRLLFFDQDTFELGYEAYEWWADSIPVEDRRYAKLETRFPWAAKQLGKGEVYHVPDVEGLPDEAAAERADLTNRGVRSQLAVPLLTASGITGLLCVENSSEVRNWSSEAITMLRLAGDTMASAVRRRRSAFELRESQKQLEQSQKMEAVGTLAGGIAHDFNNQLAVMLGNTRYCLDYTTNSNEVREALGDVLRAAEHCAELTKGLLAFSRRTPVKTFAIDVCETIEEVRALVIPLLPPLIELEIQIEVEPDSNLVAADRVQLQQVLINLVVNARDAMPSGGRLVISARNIQPNADETNQLDIQPDRGCIEIHVADEGVGMAPEVGRRVFEPFFTTKDVGAGTGLGLATAYGIVQQVGGLITFESTPGVGTKFRILLPAVSSDEAIDNEALDIDQDTDGEETILLVEDEAALRRLIRRMLTRKGYKVIEACNGGDALANLERSNPKIDMLITDFMMPVMGGAELANKLLEERPDLPVIFLSGLSSDEIEDIAQRSPNILHLQKPFDDEAFYSALRKLLQPVRP